MKVQLERKATTTPQTYVRMLIYEGLSTSTASGPAELATKASSASLMTMEMEMERSSLLVCGELGSWIWNQGYGQSRIGITELIMVLDDMTGDNGF